MLRSESAFEKLRSESAFEKLRSESAFEKLRSESAFEKLRSESALEKLRSERTFEKLRSESMQNVYSRVGQNMGKLIIREKSKFGREEEHQILGLCTVLQRHQLSSGQPTRYNPVHSRV
jgi:hypothetical protein